MAIVVTSGLSSTAVTRHAAALLAEIRRQADGLLFVSPEYNGSYTAALKNAVDYLKEGEFMRKVIAPRPTK